MIIFDLDALADCEHRMHFIDPCKNPQFSYRCNPRNSRGKENFQELSGWYHLETNTKFIADYKSFNEACGEDKPIKSCIDLLEYIGEGKEYVSDTPWVDFDGIQIWTTRCESLRNKTEKWLSKHLKHYRANFPLLRMRPEGLDCTQERLFEHWTIEENVKKLIPLKIGEIPPLDKKFPFEFVFSSHKPTMDMFRRRGIFVFNCAQSDGEFNG